MEKWQNVFVLGRKWIETQTIDLDSEYCIFHYMTVTHLKKQWAADITHSLLMREPPQTWPPNLCRLTCQGQLPAGASSPPTILVFRGVMPHTANKYDAISGCYMNHTNPKTKIMDSIETANLRNLLARADLLPLTQPHFVQTIPHRNYRRDDSPQSNLILKSITLRHPQIGKPFSIIWYHDARNSVAVHFTQAACNVSMYSKNTVALRILTFSTWHGRWWTCCFRY